MTANRYKSLTNSTDDQIVQFHRVVKVTGAQTLILDEWDVSLATNRRFWHCCWSRFGLRNF